MIINRISVKQAAKAKMKGKTPPVYLIAVAFVAISTILSILLSLLSGYNEYANAIYDRIMSGAHITASDMVALVPKVTFVASIIMLAIRIMDTVIQVSFLGYTLKVYRDVPAGYKELFSGFEIFFKIICLAVLQWFFIFLWSLLFFIPGIVAAYRYSQSYYILLEHPDWSAFQCLNESKRITYGYKGQLFMLDLSFIGWMLLSGIISTLIIIPVLDIWLIPYMGITRAAYYDILRQIADRQNGDSQFDFRI